MHLPLSLIYTERSDHVILIACSIQIRTLIHPLLKFQRSFICFLILSDKLNILFIRHLHTKRRKILNIRLLILAVFIGLHEQLRRSVEKKKSRIHHTFVVFDSRSDRKIDIRRILKQKLIFLKSHTELLAPHKEIRPRKFLAVNIHPCIFAKYALCAFNLLARIVADIIKYCSRKRRNRALLRSHTSKLIGKFHKRTFLVYPCKKIVSKTLFIEQKGILYNAIAQFLYAKDIPANFFHMKRRLRVCSYAQYRFIHICCPLSLKFYDLFP